METFYEKTSPGRQGVINCRSIRGKRAMARKSQPKRDTFRHGNLPEALVDAALARLEAEGVESISLRDLARDAAVKAPGEPALIAGGVGFYLFARDFPNLFHLMAGARINTEGKFPDLEAAIMDALQIFAVGFAGTGMAPNIVLDRTAVFVAALQGVVTQILHRRLRVPPAKAKAFVTDVCKMLIKGMR